MNQRTMTLVQAPRITVLAQWGSAGLAAVLAATLIAAPAAAQPTGGQRQGPPPEAVAACKSLTSGAACQFNGPRGAVSGLCFSPQQGMVLACRPKDAPAPGATASGPKR